MEREIFEGKEYLIGYHSQENRKDAELLEPIKCESSDAWLGIGYYFWVSVEFAKYWGEDFKTNKKNNPYDIYKGFVDSSQFLNTVFNEKHYYKFKEFVDAVTQKLMIEDEDITLLSVHKHLSDNYWSKLGVTGILYDDLPNNKQRKNSLIRKETNKSEFFYYKKRIQFVVFDLKNVRNFTMFLKKQIK